MTNFEKAKQWRAQHGYTGKGGVIVIWGATVQGWVCQLTEPDHWVPGCIAVSEDGECYEAVGGNDGDGARDWRMKEKEAA